MNNQQLVSAFLKLCKTDFAHGLIMAVLGAVVGVLAPVLQSLPAILSSGGALPDIATLATSAWHLALGAATAYLVKKLFSGPTGAFLGVAPQQPSAENTVQK